MAAAIPQILRALHRFQDEQKHTLCPIYLKRDRALVYDTNKAERPERKRHATLHYLEFARARKMLQPLSQYCPEVPICLVLRMETPDPSTSDLQVTQSYPDHVIRSPPWNLFIGNMPKFNLIAAPQSQKHKAFVK